MSNFEKGIVAVIVLLVLYMVSTFITLQEAINDAGGFKQVVIEAGKEIKDISREINKK